MLVLVSGHRRADLTVERERRGGRGTNGVLGETEREGEREIERQREGLGWDIKYF